MKTIQLLPVLLLGASASWVRAQEPSPGAEASATPRARATKLIGANVKNTANEHLGEIEDIVLDSGSRRIAYVVVGFGGFLGLGEKFFAMPWGMITFTPRQQNEAPFATLAIDKDVLKRSPGFDKKNWPDFSNRTWAMEVDAFYKDKFEAPKVTAGVVEGEAAATEVKVGVPQNPKNKDFAHRRLSKLIGLNVVDPGRRSLGDIEDAIVALPTGTVDGFVLGYGGVVGVGEKLVLLPFESVTWDRVHDEFVLASSKARLDTVAFGMRKWPNLTDDAWLTGGRGFFKRTEAGEATGEQLVAFRDFYDSKKTENVSGVITTVGSVHIGDERDDRLRLRIAMDDGREVVVYAAPRGFADQDALDLRPGKRIEITGARAPYGSQTVLVAGSLKLGDSQRTVRLRDDEGRALWLVR
jgi:sporulation protein YlmC with PRC-barrel domain